ncbi:MAG: hypothetical protein NT091_01675 [Candidatus Falkowbacteria bacterium]|nr:hypothetical protein [Candidatus Falkowbacteria bacterium]
MLNAIGQRFSKYIPLLRSASAVKSSQKVITHNRPLIENEAETYAIFENAVMTGKPVSIELPSDDKTMSPVSLWEGSGRVTWRETLSSFYLVNRKLPLSTGSQITIRFTVDEMICEAKVPIQNKCDNGMFEILPPAQIIRKKKEERKAERFMTTHLNSYSQVTRSSGIIINGFTVNDLSTTGCALKIPPFDMPSFSNRDKVRLKFTQPAQGMYDFSIDARIQRLFLHNGKEFIGRVFLVPTNNDGLIKYQIDMLLASIKERFALSEATNHAA